MPDRFLPYPFPFILPFDVTQPMQLRASLILCRIVVTMCTTWYPCVGPVLSPRHQSLPFVMATRSDAFVFRRRNRIIAQCVHEMNRHRAERTAGRIWKKSGTDVRTLQADLNSWFLIAYNRQHQHGGRKTGDVGPTVAPLAILGTKLKLWTFVCVLFVHLYLENGYTDLHQIWHHSPREYRTVKNPENCPEFVSRWRRYL
jgi:hypothetical protein